MEIVSGLGEKPHVTSQQFRQILEGTIGQKSYIVTSGENLEPELAANNLLKIRSGMMSHHGNVSSVKIGTYDEVELTNGSQGMKRIDLVVNRYTRNAETNIEKNEWVVIMGTPVASNPVAPTYTVGNLQKGDLVDDCPVFELHYDGINVTEVKKMLSVLPNVAELNSKTMNLEYASVKRRVDAATLAVGKEYTFEQDCYVYFGASFTSTSGYCRVYVTNENDEIVHYVQINPAPTSANAQTTHEYFAKKWWKIKTGSYGSLCNNVISYSLIY